MQKLHNNKYFLSIFLVIISIIVATFAWDNISLPYYPDKAIYGDSYIQNQHNSFNDTLRFIFFVFFPLSVFFFSQIFFENKNFNNFFYFINYDFSKKNFINNLNYIFFFLIIIIFIEFFCIDFSKLNYEMDIFHEGLWLTSSSNLKIKKEIFTSSYVGRGLYGNFHPSLLWQVIGFDSIGIIRFFSYLVNLLIKFLSLLLVKKITLSLDFKKNQQIIFFLLMSLVFLYFTPYGQPIFYDRYFILFFFIILLLNFFFNNFNFVTIFALGTFSAISMFWYIDIGAYINFFLLILIFFLLIKKKIKEIILLFLGAFVSWFLFYILLTNNEFISFLHNIKSIYQTIDQIHGLIFPTPFLGGDTRSTKILLLFITTGVLIINLLFDQKNKHFVFSMIIFYIFSVLTFKYGLSRSDGVHIRIGGGLISVTFLFILVFYFVTFFEKFLKKKNNYDKKIKFTFLVLIIFCFFYLYFEKKYESKSIKNFNYFFSSVSNLIKLEDKFYINNEYSLILDFYSNLTKEDKCVYVFTNELAIPYLLKKPTCSKHFINYISSPVFIQKEIIKDLKNKKPQYILYKSRLDLYEDSAIRLKYVNEFIKKNYSIFSNYLNWEVYKINDI